MSIELRPLGRTGIHVSRFGLGAMVLGAWGNTDRDACRRIIGRTLDAGINLIDTADMYADGENEEIVGEAIAARRDEIVLCTKFHYPVGDHDDPNRRGNSRRWIRQAVDDSLRRLGTDRIDLYQVHRPDPTTDIAETVAALDDLVTAGKILAWGTSTFPAEEIVLAHWAAERNGHVGPHTEQPPYSILARGIERDVLPTAERFGMGVLVWSPLAGGWLTGKYSRTSPPPIGSRAQTDPDHFDGANPAKFDAVERLSAIAARGGDQPDPHGAGLVCRAPGGHHGVDRAEDRSPTRRSARCGRTATRHRHARRDRRRGGTRHRHQPRRRQLDASRPRGRTPKEAAMKAVRYHGFGGTEVLEYEDVPDPEPGPVDVVIDVAATALNRLDVVQRNGWFNMPGFALPHIAGMDVAGVVLGDRRRGLDRGGRRPGRGRPVAGRRRRSVRSWAEWATCTANSASSAPRSTAATPSSAWYRPRMSTPCPTTSRLEQAAPFATCFVTSAHALFDVGKLRSRRNGDDPRRRIGPVDGRDPARQARRGDRAGHGGYRREVPAGARRWVPTSCSTTAPATSPVGPAR